MKNDILRPEALRGALPRLAMYTMMGFITGYMFFYSIFHYYAEPFSGATPMWFLALVLASLGFIGGYLYPDIMNVIAMSLALPTLGAVFCFAIFMSPVMSPELTNIGSSDSFFILARYMLPSMFMAFPTVFLAGFVSLYLFEPEGTAS